MLSVTKSALAAIQEHLRQHNMDFTIRITMMRGGCIGENLRFTLDEMQPNDLVFSVDGLTFLLDRDLSARCGAIEVDFAAEYDHCPCSGRNGGFSISSERFSFRCGGKECCNSCSGDCAGHSAETCSSSD